MVNGLKREELVALNSTLLHELYFASLGGDGTADDRRSPRRSTRDFGSVDRWRDEFVAMAKALAGGSGWVLLVYVPRDGRLINQNAAEHSQAVAGGIPILALDMYEHAYHIDFGANAKAYVDAFMRNIDWKASRGALRGRAKVARRDRWCREEFGDLPGVGVEEVKAMLDAGKPVQLIDARPGTTSRASRTSSRAPSGAIRSASRNGSASCRSPTPVVVFCAYGFHVGCKTAIALREAGFDARYMKGGHSAWKAIGGPIENNP